MELEHSAEATDISTLEFILQCYIRLSKSLPRFNQVSCNPKSAEVYALLYGGYLL